jgi:hypothetical protein
MAKKSPKKSTKSPQAPRKRTAAKPRQMKRPEPKAADKRQPIKLSAKKRGFPRRDEEGPLGWLSPVLESTYTPLVPAGPGVAQPRAGGPVMASTLQPGSVETPLPAVPPTVWRDLLTEYKQRKAAAQPVAGAAAAPSAAALPFVPGAKNWLPLGPTVVMKGQTEGQQPVGGRVSGVAIAPGGQLIYAASANGGVFRSEDGAATWKALMDGFDISPTNFASASVVCGAIAIDPADPKRVYVGTGEGDTDQLFRFRIVNALPAYRGVGPVRSDDGGATWVPETSNPDLAGKAFFALAVDPRDRENVVAATTNGLYQRVSSGAGGGYQWVAQRPGVHPAAVVASAGSTTRFFAAEWGKGVVYSTDGKSWKAAGTGFPAGNVGRIALGVQPNNPSLVYALATDNGGKLLGLYRLDAVTGPWTQLLGAPNILPGSQGFYDLCIAVDPGDPDTVFIGGDRTNAYPFSGMIYRCEVHSSGGSYSVSNSASIGSYAHADVHCLAHTPGDPTELWCGCDGGLFLNRNPRDGGEFGAQNNGLSCLCSNFFAQHPTDPNVLLTGLQDNGTAWTDSGPIWTHVQDGDGGYCLIHWAKPDKVLVYMNGSVFRSTSGGSDPNSWQPVWQFDWATMTQPVVSAPYKPSKPTDADVVAVGAGDLVYVSQNFASTWPASLRIALPPGSGSAFALAFASPNRLFIGTTTGRVFRTDRTTGSWTLSRLDNAAAGPIGVAGLISDVAVDWADASLSSIYVAFGGMGDSRRVWWFDGTQWLDRSGPPGGDCLLNVEHNALAVDRTAPANVYVGADIGVWHSADRGGTWKPLRNGLPGAPVFDLQIHLTQRLLRAATYGRGVYEIPLD